MSTVPRLRRPRRSVLLLASTILACTGLATFHVAQLVSTTRAAVPRYSLVDTSGRVLGERAESGHYRLAYVGFTSCGAFCPASLTKMGLLLRALGSDANQLQPLFVSIDPAHDTAELMTAYLAAFDPRIVGATGDADQLAAFAAAYGVYYRASAANAQMRMPQFDHANEFLLIAPDGRLADTFTPELSVADLRRRIRFRLGLASGRSEPT